MKHINLIIFLIIYSFYSLQAQIIDCNYNDSIELKIELIEDTIKSISVFKYKIILTNQSSVPQTVLQPWNDKYFFPQLQIRKGIKEWTTLRSTEKSTSLHHSHSHDLLIIVTLLPDSSVSTITEWGTGIDPINTTDTGLYEVRLSSNLYYCTHRKKLYSKSVQLYIEGDEGIDKAAEKWLINNLPHPGIIYSQKIEKHYMIISYPSKIYKYNLNLEEKLNEFIKLFPNSKFTPWVMLYLVEWKHKYTTIEEKIVHMNTLTKNQKYPRVKKILALLTEIEKEYLIDDNDYQKIFQSLFRQTKYKHDNIRSQLGW